MALQKEVAAEKRHFVVRAVRIEVAVLASIKRRAHELDGLSLWLRFYDFLKRFLGNVRPDRGALHLVKMACLFGHHGVRLDHAPDFRGVGGCWKVRHNAWYEHD